ncbi:MAG TPA: TetR/AcrR family transcriptional regulator [Polyangiaceae bacterium]
MGARRSRPEPGRARDAILEAAEKRLREAGPGAIRLQDVAAEVGVSHPAVLHHFGSREGLVRAVVERAVHTLQQDLARALAGQLEKGRADGAALFERVFRVLSDEGHARLLAWLLLSGEDPLANDALRAGWAGIAEVTHAMRVAKAKGRRKPSYEDTRFTILLSALALFGQAIAGRATFAAAGFEPTADMERRFREWLAALLARHLEEEPRPSRARQA